MIVCATCYKRPPVLSATAFAVAQDRFFFVKLTTGNYNDTNFDLLADFFSQNII